MANETAPSGGGENLAGLIRAVATAGDRQAFTQLFHAVAPKLKTFVIRRGASADAAEEVVQDTMLAVWRSAGRFDPIKAGAWTWIYAIGRNKQIDQIRRQAPSAGAAIAPDDLADHGVEPHATVEARQVLAKVSRGLSSEQREVLHKAYYEGKSHGEIANELALPLGTVKSRVRLALAHMRAAAQEVDA